MLFAKYVNDNAERFRSKMVDHEGKKKLTVVWDYTDRNNEFDITSEKFRWDIFT